MFQERWEGTGSSGGAVASRKLERVKELVKGDNYILMHSLTLIATTASIFMLGQSVRFNERLKKLVPESYGHGSKCYI